MDQLALALHEAASPRMEALIAATCPAHPGTTLDGGDCAICELDTINARMSELDREAPDAYQTETYIRLEERSWELEERIATPVSPWVRRATEAQLPAKVYAR